MATIDTTGLTPMQAGRLALALAKPVRIDGVVTTWREHVLTLTGEKRQSDGMADYNRVRFNRMNEREQRAYIARLEAKRVYMLAATDPKWGQVWNIVPKVIYDAVRRDPDPAEAEALAQWSDADSVALFGTV